MEHPINDCRKLTELPIGYRWESAPRATGYLWTLCFGLLTGDRNRAHVSPFSSYRSRFKGKIRHGISTVAQAEAASFQIFSRASSVEVFTVGYAEGPRYFKEVPMGSHVRYAFTLKSVSVHPNDQDRVRVWWRVEALLDDGTVAMTAVWMLDYVNCKPKEVVVPRWLTFGFWREVKVPLPDLWSGVTHGVALAVFVIVIASPFVVLCLDPMLCKCYDMVAL